MLPGSGLIERNAQGENVGAEIHGSSACVVELFWAEVCHRADQESRANRFPCYVECQTSVEKDVASPVGSAHNIAGLDVSVYFPQRPKIGDC